MAEYKVLRRHDGDKEYHAGDTRTAAPSDVKHLVTLGLLALLDGKAEADHQNKMEGQVLNKAEAADKAAADKAAADKAAADKAAADKAAADKAAADKAGE